MSEEFLKERLDSAARIRKIREEGGYTQEQFAEILEISLSGYKKIENAENQISLNGLRKLEKKLHISADYILFGANENFEAVWEKVQACTDANKMRLMITLMLYFSRTRHSAFYREGGREEMEKTVFRILDEIQKCGEE